MSEDSMEREFASDDEIIIHALQNLLLSYKNSAETRDFDLDKRITYAKKVNEVQSLINKIMARVYEYKTIK